MMPDGPDANDLVVVDAAGSTFAIPAPAVRVVLPFVHHRPLPGVRPWLRGVVERQGVLLPLVDLAILVGGAAVPARRRSRIVIVGAGEDTTEDIALAVEGVTDVVERPEEATAHPGFDFPGSRHLGEVVVLDGTPTPVLRVREILDPEERAALFARLDNAGAAP